MKVLLVVLALSTMLVGCEQKKAEEDSADQFAGQSADEAAKKPGAWMWDKGRGNPLEQPPY